MRIPFEKGHSDTMTIALARQDDVEILGSEGLFFTYRSGTSNMDANGGLTIWQSVAVKTVMPGSTWNEQIGVHKTIAMLIGIASWREELFTDMKVLAPPQKIILLRFWGLNDMAWFLFRISPNSMGDDGIMSKGTRYTDEFKAKAVRLLTESRPSYSSETKAIAEVARDLGVSSETLRRWRNQSDASAAEQSEQSAQEAMAELKRLRAENAELRRANEILTTASAFFAARLDPTRP
ncbi:hypothetical protein BAAA27672_07190 [Bifidobacterium animalis subsp. animalis ATCC 27672]|nr:hypothetical protein BAAA27672_07190 [Bifidobacterium animalis subsp. animalis ATCC 27672]